jgi:thiamine biosynthesis lipoprotein
MTITRHLRFPAMGSSTEAVVTAANPTAARRALSTIRRIVCALDASWTRFAPDSNLLRAHAGGRPVQVPRPLLEVVSLALAARVATGGRFDPLVGRCLIDLGYDDDLATVRSRGPIRAVVRPAPANDGYPGVRVDPIAGTLAIDHGIHLDLGGIGKGAAADRAAAAALAHCGVTSAWVCVGGDLAYRTANPTYVPVLVDDHPVGGAPSTTIAVLGGGVATSAIGRRRWQTTTGPVHHIVDPRTGAPVRPSLVQVTVHAGTGAWAEVCATHVLVASAEVGPIAALEDLALLQAVGFGYDATGRRHDSPGLAAHLPAEAA